jgi:protein-serine/threonine kinase
MNQLFRSAGYNEGQKERKGVLAKSRKFQDTYEEYDRDNPPSSGSSKKVMDFFRQMGKQRASRR